MKGCDSLPPQPSGPWPSLVVAEEGPRKATVSHALDLFCPVLGENKKEEMPAGSRAVGCVGGASKPGIRLWAPWTEGLSPTAVLFSPGSLLGWAEPGRLELTPQLSWQEQRPPA